MEDAEGVRFADGRSGDEGRVSGEYRSSHGGISHWSRRAHHIRCIHSRKPKGKSRYASRTKLERIWCKKGTTHLEPGYSEFSVPASSGRFMAVSGIGHAVRIVYNAHTAKSRKEKVDTRHERS